MPEIAPVPGVWPKLGLSSRRKAIAYAARKLLTAGVLTDSSLTVFLESLACIEAEYEEIGGTTCYRLVIPLSRCMPGPAHLEKKSRELLFLRSTDHAVAEIPDGHKSACEHDGSRAPQLSPQRRGS